MSIPWPNLPGATSRSRADAQGKVSSFWASSRRGPRDPQGTELGGASALRGVRGAHLRSGVVWYPHAPLKRRAGLASCMWQTYVGNIIKQPNVAVFASSFQLEGIIHAATAP